MNHIYENYQKVEGNIGTVFNLKYNFTPDNITQMHDQQRVIQKHPKFLILEIDVI